MKNRFFLIFLIAFSLHFNLFAEEAMQNYYSREKISLNGKWDILTDPFCVGTRNKWYIVKQNSDKHKLNQINYDACQKLEVPGDWNHQIPELSLYEGNVWYRRLFDAPSINNNRLFICFGAVSMSCTVYLNGEQIGEHVGAFTPFQIEVTNKLKPKANDLIVRVDNRRSKNMIPAEAFDWYNYGGITRNVDLVAVPQTYINDYYLKLDKSNSNLLNVMVKLNGVDKVGKKVFVSMPESKMKLELTTDNNGIARYSKKTKLNKWSPTNPKLYNVEISSDADKISDKIGFRTIQVDGEKILLNGKPIFLKGVNIHEEIASEKRRACTKEDDEFFVNNALELGCNFIRLAHYSHNEYMVRLAEEKGLMMWEEIPVWQGINFKDSSVCNLAKNMMNEMVGRDKNRCGIIIWSVSNETGKWSKERNEFLPKLVDYTHELDNTRLVSSALHMATPVKTETGYVMKLDDPLIEHLDVVGCNKYMGWYTPFPCAPENLSWEIGKGKPMIISEFGAEAVQGNEKGDPTDVNSWSEGYMAQAYKNNLTSFKNATNICGISPWILFDFRSAQRSHSLFQSGWNRKGLISPENKKKKAWYIMHDFYKSIK